MDAINTIRSAPEIPDPAVPDAGSRRLGHDDLCSEDGIARLRRGPSDGRAAGDEAIVRSGSPESEPDSGDGLVELPEPPERLYTIRVEGPMVPGDPVLAAALQEMREAADRDPNRFRNNPERKREALEGFRRLIEEYEAEFGAFTEEEIARARLALYGP